MALTAYLALTAWLGQQPLYCEQGSTCDIVRQSRWGTFLAAPTAFWGFLTYATLTYIGVLIRSPGRQWKLAWTVSLMGLCYSVYLSAISLLVIEALCAYCLASLSIMAVIFGVVIYQRPADLPDFNYAAWAGKTIVIIMVIVGGMHLHYSGVFYVAADPEDPYLKGLAEHLSRENAIFYGAFW
ncbi:MAG: vitamin K epoxide reductase family protein [Candidatus Mariimomonas ferrooxydans]